MDFSFSTPSSNFVWPDAFDKCRRYAKDLATNRNVKTPIVLMSCRRHRKCPALGLLVPGPEFSSQSINNFGSKLMFGVTRIVVLPKAFRSRHPNGPFSRREKEMQRVGFDSTVIPVWPFNFTSARLPMQDCRSVVLLSRAFSSG
jgi:hypothetical protein